MDFEQFANLNTLGQLAGVNQRTEQNRLLHQQADLLQQKADLEKNTQKQNQEILKLLQEQKEKEDKEKQRLASLPKCPDCMHPVEEGSRKCRACHSKIVIWDYQGDGKSWRLSCRESEAKAKLKERIGELLKSARDLKLQCIHICATFDEAWLNLVYESSKLVEQITDQQKTERSQELLKYAINKYLCGQMILLPDDEKKCEEEEELWKKQSSIKESEIRNRINDKTEKN